MAWTTLCRLYTSSQSFKYFLIVNYNSRVVLTKNYIAVIIVCERWTELVTYYFTNLKWWEQWSPVTSLLWRRRLQRLHYPQEKQDCHPFIKVYNLQSYRKIVILSSRHQTINFSSFLLKSKHYKPKNISVSLILLNTELHVLTVDQIRYWTIKLIEQKTFHTYK